MISGDQKGRLEEKVNGQNIEYAVTTHGTN